MSTGFDDSDELLEAYLAESGEAALGEEAAARVWEDGREAGEWTVTGFLARGGSAEVYCAKHRRLGTRAALKVLWRDGAGPRERFERETRFLMGNPGPSFPAFYGAGVEDGRPWVAMELLDECPLPEADREVARYLLDVGEGVAALHARGWLHRDIKQGNVLRRADGHAVLADFGLLKAVGTGDAAADAAAERGTPSVVDGREAGVGTPGWSAPEQFAGGGATPAADVYALGMLAEECFGGQPPRAWEKIIRRATAALPRQRYPGVAPMLRAIRRRHWRRNWAWAAAAVVLAGALGAGWWAGREGQRAEATRTAAAARMAAREAEEAREAAVLRASEGDGREVVEGILRDMAALEGAVLIGRHEVTQSQWEALMENNPSRFKGADRPVEGAGVGDWLEFVGRLNRMPSVRASGLRFRFPTREEWILAAGDRLVRRQDYWHQVAMASGDPDHGPLSDPPDETGWFAENSGGETHPVGQTSPDGRGLFDCYGNVSEVVSDVVHLKSLMDDCELTGLRCMGGNCLQEREKSDMPVLLAVLGREIETLPEEWQTAIRATGIPVRLQEPVAADPELAAKFSGLCVGLRLCADRGKTQGKDERGQ